MPSRQRSVERKTEDEVLNTRLSVNINQDTARTLRDLAERKDLSFTEIVRRAVAVYGVVADAQDRGDVIQVVGEKTTKELLIV